MLLKVEYFPHSYKVPSSGQLKPAEDPLYVSPNIKRDGSNDGKEERKSSSLLVVGRKNGDIVLNGDKSVSRQHMQLLLVSASSGLEGVAQAPSTPAERDACAQNVVDDDDDDGCGLCVTVQDSSKFGTYCVLENHEDITLEQKASAEDSATDNDMTDNEAPQASSVRNDASQDKSFQVLSEVTKRLVSDPAKCRLQRIPTDDSVVLTSLLNWKGNQNTPRRAIIQCGQNGSTLVVTRVPLNLVFTKPDKTVKESLIPKVRLNLGASIASDFALSLKGGGVTHLVAKERVSNAKSLTAWLSQTPVVTIAYLQAWLDRTTPTDPIPVAKKFSPDPNPQSRGETFWDLTPNPRLWSPLTLMSLQSDDMEHLCRAAGAKIIRLYPTKGDDEAENEKTSILTSSKAIVKYIDHTLKTHAGCFFVNTTTSKHATVVKHMKKVAKLPHVTNKLLALYASKQETLEDVEGNPIGDAAQPEQEEESTPSPLKPSRPNEDEDANESGIQSQNPFSADAETQRTSPSNQRRSRRVDSGEDPSGWSRKRVSKREEQAEEGEDKEERPSQRRRRRGDDADEVNDETAKRAGREPENEKDRSNDPREEKLPKRGKVDSSQQRKRARTQDEEVEGFPCDDDNEGDEVVPSQDDDEDKVSSTKSKRSRSDKEDNNEECDDDNQGQSGPRKKLPKASNGWLIAAPPGKKQRSAFRRSNDEIKEKMETERDLPPTAPTESCKGLIVPTGRSSGRNTESSSRSRSKGQIGVKNFKKFRKNRVPCGTVVVVRLRSVLPKESELQRQMEEDSQRLQAEQRLADALFQDRGGGGVGGSRGVRSHFAAGNSSKPRRRRHV